MIDGLIAGGAEMYTAVLWSCSKETDWEELILRHGCWYYVDSWTVLRLIMICMQSYSKRFPIQHVIVFHVWFILMEDQVLRVWGSLCTGEMESSVRIYMENLMKMHVYLISYHRTEFHQHCFFQYKGQ
jgi:hypothetical protein